MSNETKGNKEKKRGVMGYLVWAFFGVVLIIALYLAIVNRPMGSSKVGETAGEVPSASISPSVVLTPLASLSLTISPSPNLSPSASESPSLSPSASPSPSISPSPSAGSPSPSLSPLASPSPSTGSGIFTDGPGGDVNTAKDMQMSSSWSTHNGGAHANFELDGAPGAEQHTLFEFDLSVLSPSYTCLSAKLYLYRSYAPEGAGNNTGKIYSIDSANSSWIEGTKDIKLADAGEPCWDALEADGAGGVQTAWAGSSGCSTRGTDYELPSIGTWSFDANSAIGTEIVIDLDTGRVQGWFGDTNTNYGIILIPDDNIQNAHVGSSDNPTSAYRPKLVVIYRITNP